MNRFVIALGVFIVLVSVQAAEASIEAHIAGGLSLPQAPTQFTDYWSTGWSGTVGVGLRFRSGPVFSMQLDLDRHPFSTDHFARESASAYRAKPGPGGSGATEFQDVTLVPGSRPDGGEVYTTTVSLGVEWPLMSDDAIVAPFVYGGFGYVHQRFAALSLSTTDGVQTFPAAGRDGAVFQLGVGTDLCIRSRVSLFVRTTLKRLTFSGDEGTTLIPVQVGVRIWR